MRTPTEISASIFDFVPLSFEASGHINQMKFKGVLVTLDGPSTRPPNGSGGRRIYIPTSVAQAALPTLKDMGLNYKPDLDGHAPRRKVGVIKKAWIEGKNLWVSGIVWKKDFPEAEKDLKKDDLGMSFEASEIAVEDPNAEMWKLTHLTFTGATILYKTDAAYYHTSAIAAQAQRLDATSREKKTHGGSMAQSNTKKNKAAKASKVHASTDGSKTQSRLEKILLGLTASVQEQTKSFKGFQSSNNALRQVILAGARKKEDVSVDASADQELDSVDAGGDSEERDSVEAGKSSKSVTKVFAKDDADSSSDDDSSGESSSEEMSAEGEGNLSDMGSDEHESDEPGHLNESADQKGDKTTVSDTKDTNKSVTAAGLTKLTKQVNYLISAGRADRQKIKKLEKTNKRLKAQAELAAEGKDRRTYSGVELSAMAHTLLAKGGIDADALRDSGTKVSVEEMDAVFLNCGVDLTINQRVALKSEFARKGVMDEGIVARRSIQ